MNCATEGGLQLLDSLWSDEPVTFEGEHYRLIVMRLSLVRHCQIGPHEHHGWANCLRGASESSTGAHGPEPI